MDTRGRGATPGLRAGDQALLAAAERHAAYMAGFRKTESGAAVRYENAALELPPGLPPDHPDFAACREWAEQMKNGGPCVFVDSMHFDAPFYAALHRVTGKQEYRQLALETALSQIQLLYDPQDGLFHHFWIEHTRRRNGVAWACGNGWGLLGLLDTLENLSPADPAAGEIREVLCCVLARMAALQDSCGGWHTVLNDATSYIEASVAAFMICAIGRARCRRPLCAGHLAVAAASSRCRSHQEGEVAPPFGQEPGTLPLVGYGELMI